MNDRCVRCFRRRPLDLRVPSLWSGFGADELRDLFWAVPAVFLSVLQRTLLPSLSCDSPSRELVRHERSNKFAATSRIGGSTEHGNATGNTH